MTPPIPARVVTGLDREKSRVIRCESVWVFDRGAIQVDPGWFE